MSIYITGDTHANLDIVKLRRKDFMATENDYVIVCGDFGVVWGNDVIDDKLKEWYDSKPWTTLFVDGNHENHDLLNLYPVEMWSGGKVHRISNKIIHLMRGQVYNIEGKTFFTMGGAKSQDKAYRTEGKSWWASEMPSRAEMDEGIDNLDAVGNKVDYILSHCAPASVQQLLAYWYEQDSLTRYLELVRQTVDFEHWFTGHYHLDKEIGNKFTVLYDNIVKIV